MDVGGICLGVVDTRVGMIHARLLMSMLMRVFLRLLAPLAGSLRVAGCSVWEDGVGWMFWRCCDG